MARRVFEPEHEITKDRFNLIRELQERYSDMPEVQKKLENGMRALRKTEREILSYYDLTDMEVNK